MEIEPPTKMPSETEGGWEDMRSRLLAYGAKLIEEFDNDPAIQAEAEAFKKRAERLAP